MPNRTSVGLGTPIQLKKALRLDVVNEKPADDNFKLYEVESIQQVSDVIAGIFHKKIEDVKPMIDEFVKKETIDIAKPMFLVAYLIEDKE